MEQANKGKPINTSVPSIAIRFHANAEEIEELYQSEEESTDKTSNEKTKHTGVLGDPDSSPLRSYLPRLGKRSTSIDTSLTAQDSSPPSDRWKFFTEIKGKITKSVEDTITEMKHRNQDNENSSKKGKLTKDKDNSSLSDSEDLSESSISKTCGVSTTEGVEMSSDDETPSLESDKNQAETSKPKSRNPSEISLKQKLKINRKKKPYRESVIGSRTLAYLYELNTGIKARSSLDKGGSSEENVEEVESGVEAFEDVNLQSSNTSLPPTETEESDLASTNSDIKFAEYFAHRASTDEEIISSLVEHIDNLEVDDSNVLNLQQVAGTDIRREYFSGNKIRTFLAPEGFVDLRPQGVRPSWFEVIDSYKYIVVMIAISLLLLWISLPIYLGGFITGIMFTLFVTGVHKKPLHTSSTSLINRPFDTYNSQPILEIPAVKEYQPLIKFEGWMNEYPDAYDPKTYHICQTQSVYIRIQANLLRISHTRAKIPMRAMWNEAKPKLVFNQHRIYNLLGARVCLLPEGLNKKRHWSKKYPICITLNKDQLDFEVYNADEKSLVGDEKSVKTNSDTSVKSKPGFLRRKKVPVQPQIFSKLTEEEEDLDMESGSSRPSTPTPPEGNSREEDVKIPEDNIDILKEEDEAEDDILSLLDWTMFTQEDDSPLETRIYLFGRTGREKEDWYRRLTAATHKGAHLTTTENLVTDPELEAVVSSTILTDAKFEINYVKYMAMFEKSAKKNEGGGTKTEEINQAANVLWINALMGRVLFDCIRDDKFRNIVKERIQRKMSAIKLPYFIEQLTVTELTLGSRPPLIKKASKPVLDQRGLWVDLDITYDGIVELTLQTKLNLMKLKQPPSTEPTLDENRGPKWENSDLEDTAESSTDDDNRFVPTTKILDEVGNPVLGLGGTSNTSKKIIKMVDKIAESKFFQAATENRYIKKAMEGVSKTDLCLKVELKKLVGTLVLNMPPPPSDRVWIGFRPIPELVLTAQPIVGERNMSFIKQLTSWIEKKLSQEFQKLLVIPNMEDIMISVMSQKLPQ